MNRAPTASTILFSMMVATMIGCVSNKPFRTGIALPGLTVADPSKAVIESWPDYKIGVVEFDDQGWFWDEQQRVEVEQMIRAQAGIDSPSATPQGIILVAFVHGWKNNAAYDGGGIAAFRAILQKLNEGEQAQAQIQGQRPRKVVGVYAGWRGLSAEWEPFKELSFWERKNTAHKVGGYGAMTRLFTELENIQKDSLDALPADAPRTELVIIGHSFGGAAVYSALSQIITERFVDSVALPKPRQKRLKPLGDQIILLNPAFEAVRHFDLNQMALAIDRYPPDQRPVLSIFTSKGDWATHYAFPLGRFFSTLFDSNRDGNQRSANLDAVGWYQPFLTHTLTYSPNASLAATQPGPPGLTTEEQHKSGFGKLLDSYQNVKTQRAKWQPGPHAPRKYYFDESVLTPMDNYKPGDPFLVVSVDQQVMHDHSDITNPVLVNFLREYIQFCQAEPHDRLK